MDSIKDLIAQAAPISPVEPAAEVQASSAGHTVDTAMSRRTILKGLGGALALSFTLVACDNPEDAVKKALPAADPDAKIGDDLFLAVDGEGTVHITIHRQEMGQGSRTGLPQIIADELEADWGRINFIQGLGDPRYGDQNTDGSTSIRRNFDRLRLVGATARHMLRAAGAQHWGIDIRQVKAENHQVINTLTGEAADYGAMVPVAAAMEKPAAEAITLKDKSQWRYINTPQRIIDMDGIITGTADFGQDVRLDGMLYAVAARPPVVGGVLKSYDKDAAMAVNGVVDVIELPTLTFGGEAGGFGFKPLGGVAVLATNTWAAIKGRAALGVTFDDGANASYDSDAFEADLWKSIDAGGKVVRKRGKGSIGFDAAGDKLVADYFVPHLVHAPMEPPAATAQFQADGTLDVYTHGQDPQTVMGTVAPYAGLEPKVENIRVHSKLLGGAFGRKSKPDFAAEAVVLAKASGKPVKMVWTREDEVQHGFYHTITAQRLTAVFDGDGKVTGWGHKVAYPTIMYTFTGAADEPAGLELGLGLVDLPFECDDIQLEACKAKAHTRIGWLRSVANIQHAFGVGSMVDEIAHKTGKNPYDQWMELIGSDRIVEPNKEGAEYHNYWQSADTYPIDTARLKATLAKVKDMSGFGREMPEGEGLGIAVHRSFLSYVATVVHVKIDDGMITTPKAWVAVDCGIAVNPDRVKSQMEGAVNFALSIAKHGKITMKDGAVVENNFDGYPVVRMDEAPDVDVAIIESDAPPAGVGEPGVPPSVPAFTNAIFAATGKRLRRLPVGNSVA